MRLWNIDWETSFLGQNYAFQCKNSSVFTCTSDISCNDPQSEKKYIKEKIKRTFTDNGSIRISILLPAGTGNNSLAACVGYC